MSALLVVLAWGAVAHQSGSGWVQALGALVGAGLAVGMLVPAFAARRLTVHCVSSPLDGEAGKPLEVRVSSGRPVRIDPVSPPGDRLQVAGVGDVTLTLRPDRRGVHAGMVLDLGTAYPFGMLWWRRRVVVPLPHLLHVAPRLGTPLSDCERAARAHGRRRPAGTCRHRRAPLRASLPGR